MNTAIFNQYYFALLKKLKDIARTKKDDCKNSRNLLRAIKNHYMSYNKTSDEYIQFFVENVATKNGQVPEIKDSYKTWLNGEEIQEVLVYKDISIKNIIKVLNNSHFFEEYFVILSIFGRSDPMTDEDVSVISGMLKNIKNLELYEADYSKIARDEIKSLMVLLMELQSESVNESSDSMKELEGTMLGKLAKEIMSEVDLTQLQASLNSEDDILKTLANPDGGLTKLLGTVSQKMISKMASGELKQEDLLQDALKFTSQFQKSGGGGGLGDLSSMMGKVQEMASAFTGGDDGEGFDMSSLQNMMSMMSGMGGMGGPKTQGGVKTQTAVNPAFNRVVKAKQLRSKLEKRRKAKENVSSKIEVKQDE